MAEGISDLLVEIRASSEKYASDLKKIRSESQVLIKGLEAIGDPLKDAERQSRLTGDAMVRSFKSAEIGAKQLDDAAKSANVSLDSLLAGGRSDAVIGEVDKLEHSLGDAHGAAIGLEQMFGIHLPRSVTRFLAESESIGPVLASAFSTVAILGMIQALTQLPALYKKLEEAVTGWDDAAQKAYQNQIELNDRLVGVLQDQEVAQIKLRQDAGIFTGVEATQHIIELMRLRLTEQQHLNTIAKEELNRLEELRVVNGELTKMPLEAARSQEELTKQVEQTAKKAAGLLEEIRKLETTTMDAAAASDAEHWFKGVEDKLKANREAAEKFAAALETGRKFAQEQIDFWNKASDQATKVIGQFGAGVGFSMTDDILAGLKTTDELVKKIIEGYQEARKIQLELINLNRAYLEFWDKELQKIRTGGMVSGGDDIKAGLAAAEKNAKAIVDNLERARKAGQQLIDQLINDISRMFTGMIANGQTFWEAFKNLGQAAVAAVADTFLSKMLHNALDPLAGKLGGLLGGEKKGAGEKFSLSGLVKGGAIAAAATAAVVGIEKVGSAIVGMFGKLRKEADKFVGEKQNPFAETVANLFKGLTDAQAIGSLTVDEVKRARISFEQLWKDFQSQAAAAGVVGQQALATMTPFLESWRSWLDGLDLAAASLEHMNKVLGFMSKVTDAAKDSEALNEAIATLQQNGASASSIIEFLGGDIESMVAAMKALNMEIPAGISGINDLMNAIARIGEIDTELQNISEQLSSAITNKLDILDNEIQQLSETLNDAAHWQKVYDDAVKESADNFKRLTDERASIEKRIASLTQDVERDKLVAALKNAKASDSITDTLVKTFKGITKGGHAFTAVATTIKTLGGSTAGVTAAQKELDDFDAAIREKEMESRRNELAELQNRLPLVIQQQHEAEAAYANASAAAQEAILAQKEYIRTRLEELRKDKDATEALSKALGIARKTEWENINDTITGLETRATKLLEERDALKLLFPAATDATQAINDMIAALRAGLTAPASAIEAPLPLQSPAAAIAEMPHTISELASLNWGFGIPSFDIGGVARYSGLAQVSEGEWMIPKSQVAQIVRLLQQLVAKDTTLVMDSTKVGKVQNRATQYGSTRSLASEVRR